MTWKSHLSLCFLSNTSSTTVEWTWQHLSGFTHWVECSSFLPQFTKHQTKPHFEWIKKSTRSAQMQWFTKPNISWLPTAPLEPTVLNHTNACEPTILPDLISLPQSAKSSPNCGSLAPFQFLGEGVLLVQAPCLPEKGAPAPEATSFSKQCSILSSVRQIFAGPVPLNSQAFWWSTGLTSALTYFSHFPWIFLG